MATKVICWNIAGRHAPLRQLADMGADVALLQETKSIPDDVAKKVDIGAKAHWDSHVWNSDSRKNRPKRLFDRWPMVVKLSDRVRVDWFNQISPVSGVAPEEFAVSGIGTVAAVRVTPQEAEPFVVVSMYARWMAPHPSAKSKWKVGYPDGSAQRIISDLSAFIGGTDPGTHRILAAGDLNMSFYDPGDDPQEFFARERTVVDRMQALGLEHVGPGKLGRKTVRRITEPGRNRRRPRFSLIMRSPREVFTNRSPSAR